MWRPPRVASRTRIAAFKGKRDRKGVICTKSNHPCYADDAPLTKKYNLETAMTEVPHGEQKYLANGKHRREILQSTCNIQNEWNTYVI